MEIFAGIFYFVVKNKCLSSNHSNHADFDEQILMHSSKKKNVYSRVVLN